MWKHSFYPAFLVSSHSLPFLQSWRNNLCCLSFPNAHVLLQCTVTPLHNLVTTVPCLLSLLKPNCYMRWLLLYLKSSLQILFWLPLKCDAPKWPVLGISLLVPGDLFQSTWLQPPSQAIMFPAPTLRCHIHLLCWQSPSDYPAGPLTQHSQIKTQSPSSNTDSPLAG